MNRANANSCDAVWWPAVGAIAAIAMADRRPRNLTKLFLFLLLSSWCRTMHVLFSSQLICIDRNNNNHRFLETRSRDSIRPMNEVLLFLRSVSPIGRSVGFFCSTRTHESRLTLTVLATKRRKQQHSVDGWVLRQNRISRQRNQSSKFRIFLPIVDAHKFLD